MAQNKSGSHSRRELPQYVASLPMHCQSKIIPGTSYAPLHYTRSAGERWVCGLRL